MCTNVVLWISVQDQTTQLSISNIWHIFFNLRNKRTMIFNARYLLSLTTLFVTVVQGVDEIIRAKRCNGSNRKKTCLFDSKKLNLDTATSIDFVAHNGKRIKCGKKKVNGDKVWYGSCAGDASDANFIRRKDTNGVLQVFGSVRVGPDVCQISPNEEGVDEMTCTAFADFPPELDGVEAPPDDDITDRALQNMLSGYNPNVIVDHETDVLQALRGNFRRRLYDDSGANIDVMVVWTKQAECQVSKLSSTCTLTTATESNIRGLIDLAVAETNTAFQLSGILSSLRLVHAYRDPVYVEPTTTAYSVALTDLRGSTDGKLDDVHAKRTLYGADMVQMLISTLFWSNVHKISLRHYFANDKLSSFVGNGQSCGRAYKSSNREYAFAVVSSSCATGYYSYAHEIGHNFVMSHDRGTENQCNTTGFRYGYRAPDATFRSILAYDCATAQCDNMPKNGCPRVQRFSNTQFLYNGKPMGNQNNNNAQQWNNIRATVASHYPAMNCNSNSQCNDNDAATVDTCNVASAVCVFTTIAPTKAPTLSPTKGPTLSPTKAPTNNPTTAPLSKAPTNSPTKAPITNSPTSAPTKAPTSSPTGVPTTVPTQAPNTGAPTSAPTKATITVAPTSTPTKAPNTGEPSNTPTMAPTDTPTTKAPTFVPTLAPSRTPTEIPTRAPTSAPTLEPIKPPTLAPTKVPTRAPIVPTPSYYMETKVVVGVSSADWTTVPLTQTYVSPIAVCTVQYDTGNALLPAVVRMQNVLSQSFQIRIQNPSNQVLTSRTVHCVVVEEGLYSLPDGRKIEGRKYRSTVTDHDGGWRGEGQTYLNRYTTPIVVGQVMTYSDTRWSVFYSRGSSLDTPPSVFTLRCGKHLGEDTPITRLAETVGYIVVEKGHASFSGTEIEFGRTPVAVIGYVEAKYTTTFATPFVSAPIVTIASQVGTNGREGSWAVITGNTTSTYMGVSVDEDQTFDTERIHPAEEVDYIALTSVGVIQLTK